MSKASPHAGGAERRDSELLVHFKPSLRARIEADARTRQISVDRWIEEVASLALAQPEPIFQPPWRPTLPLVIDAVEIRDRGRTWQGDLLDTAPWPSRGRAV